MATASPDEWRLTDYVDQVLEGLATGVFTYLAHPDVIRFTGDEAFYRAEMTRLCQGAKAMAIPLEINMLGLGGGRAFPYEPFWDIAAACGCHAVIGCDAHFPAMLHDAVVLARARDLADRHGIPVDERILLRDPRIALYNGVIH